MIVKLIAALLKEQEAMRQEMFERPVNSFDEMKMRIGRYEGLTFAIETARRLSRDDDEDIR